MKFLKYKDQKWSSNYNMSEDGYEYELLQEDDENLFVAGLLAKDIIERKSGEMNGFPDYEYFIIGIKDLPKEILNKFEKEFRDSIKRNIKRLRKIKDNREK